MKWIIRSALAALLIATSPGLFAAGTVTQTIARLGESQTYVITMTVTADASDGSVPSTALLRSGAGQTADGNPATTDGFYMIRVETDPGSPAPTDNYDIVFNDSAGLDLMGATCANRDTANSEACTPTVLVPINGAVTMVLSNNSVNSAAIVIKVYLVKATASVLGLSASSGSGGGAPTDAQYLLLAANGTLTNERVFTPGSGISGADAGAGSTYTLSADTAVMLSRATHQAGTSLYARSTTGNDTYVASLTPALTAYTRGGCIVLDADTANTGAATVNVNSLGAQSILNRAGGALADGDITANKPITLCYDGTQYIIQGDGGGAGGGDITDVGNCATGACFQSVSANQVFAGPTSGGAAVASMRALVTADLPTRTFRVPMINGFTLPDTSGNVFSESYVVKATNDRYGHLVWVYNDTSTDLILHGVFEIPQNFVSGAKACVVWTSTATSGNARWQFGYRSNGGDDTTSMDQGTDEETALEVNDAAPTSAHNRLTVCMNLTDANIAAGDSMQFRAAREGSDTTNDTMAAAAIVFGWFFEYQGR